MATLIIPQPGQITITGETTGVLVVSNDQETISGILDEDQQVSFERVPGPPLRYEMDGPPARVLGFADDGTGVATLDNTGGAIAWSQS